MATQASVVRRLALFLPMAVLTVAACADQQRTPSPTSSPAAGNPPNSATRTPAAQSTPRGTPAPGKGPNVAGPIGRPVGAEVINPIDIDVSPRGKGLPAGKGTVAQGAQLFASRCVACHGATGREGGLGPPLVGDPGPWHPGMPRTIGAYWEYPETLFDYIRRAMPFDRPGSLTNDEVYALVAWLLNQNKVIGADAEMNAQTLPDVQMPNREGFTPCWPDPCRPDVP